MMIAFFIIALVYLAIIGLMITSQWKIYVKAGKPGWACLVPIYNLIVLLEIVKKPMIWFLYLMIPLVNIIFLFRIYFALAKVFGKDTGYGIGMVLMPFVFFPMLAFGDAEYIKEDLNLEEFGKPVLNPNFESQVSQ